MRTNYKHRVATLRGITLAAVAVAIFHWVGAGSTNCAEPASLYYQTLHVPDGMRPKLAAAVSDLKETLRHATGVEFATSLDDESRGIYVRRTDSSDVPEHIGRQVPEGSGEACAVVPDGDSRLWIVGSTDLGLCHGIYLYLEQLGCRWYFP
ncbi:MAG: hypothetical protein KDA62_22360, partial [Planctomycetales bacterium]|nr:hypothetical protein [Planctomycetales bacterium]